jgi:hypothetical protein
MTGYSSLFTLSHILLRCLQGLASTATPSLPPYLSAACSALLALQRAQLANAQAASDAQQQITLLELICTFLVPSMLRYACLGMHKQFFKCVLQRTLFEKTGSRAIDEHLDGHHS